MFENIKSLVEFAYDNVPLYRWLYGEKPELRDMWDFERLPCLTRNDFALCDIEDILSQRAFADGIGKGCHPIDIQPIPDALKRYPLPHRWSFDIPYRSLLPKEIDNLLLAGRCISNTHEASGCTRPTVQCMVTGEAAGTAAALSAAQGITPRDLDAAILRARLREQGVIL